MNLDWLKPILVFLAGAGMQDMGLAARRLRGGDPRSPQPSAQGEAAMGQVLSAMGVPMPQKQSPLEQLGPTPMQTLAMIDLRRRMAAAQQGGAPMAPPMR